MATSIIMNSKSQNDKKIQRSITYVSPTATDAEILAFTEGYNGLTTNTLTDVRRVDTTDLLNDTRLDRNMSLTISTFSYAAIDSSLTGGTNTKLTFDGGGTPQFTKQIDGDGTLWLEWYDLNPGEWQILLTRDEDTSAYGTITVSLPGTDAYKPASVTITITE